MASSFVDLNTFSIKEFFQDMPWYNTPSERHAIMSAPSAPRGGLLGGAADEAPKLSKLQALAAARKKKAQEQKPNDSGIEKPMAGLKLREVGATGNTTIDERVSQKPMSRGFPLRKRKDSNPHKAPTAPPPERKPEITPTESEVSGVEQAAPSAFASTMFGSVPQTQTHHSSSVFTLPYNAVGTSVNIDPFSGPSPDDVVIAAQSQSKGVQGPITSASLAKSGISRK